MTKVSIVIPAYNEASTLREIITRVQAVDLSPHTKEILVVDNNSTDETFSIASSIPGIVVYKKADQEKVLLSVLASQRRPVTYYLFRMLT